MGTLIICRQVPAAATSPWPPLKKSGGTERRRQAKVASRLERKISSGRIDLMVRPAAPYHRP